MAASIKYRKLQDYKYQLMEKYVHDTGWRLPERAAMAGGWTTLSKTGKLTIKKGYAWDGPSGPAIDTSNFMRGSLVHDALYQLMREGLLPGRKRKPADVLLWLICLEDGMSQTRADYVFHAVRVFGGRSARARTEPERVILEAP